MSVPGRRVAILTAPPPTLTLQRTDYISISRINGELAVSRAIGDIDYKGEGMAAYDWAFPPSHNRDSFVADLVIAEPTVMSVDLVDEDEFLIMACDGLWDVMKEQEVRWRRDGLGRRPRHHAHAPQAVDYVRTRLDPTLWGGGAPGGSMGPQEACKELVRFAVRLGTSDNVTALVVCLHQQQAYLAQQREGAGEQ